MSFPQYHLLRLPFLIGTNDECKRKILRLIFIYLLIALLLKDILPIGDRYILRGSAQFICLIAGVLWLFSSTNKRIFSKYGFLFGYLIALIVSCVVNGIDYYVLFQIGSLAAILLFSVSYFDSSNEARYVFAVNNIVYAYAIVLLLSIVAIKFYPNLAYSIEHVTGQKRFSGLFGEPATMGVVSGILVGLSFFGLKNKLLKIICTSIALMCLAITLSRTFWVATIIAFIITIFLYSGKSKKLIASTVVVLCFVALLSSAIKYEVDKEEIGSVTRTESIENLSGRTYIWAIAYESALKKPMLGYGYTVGADGVSVLATRGLDSRDYRDRATLHSGYVQSLLDSGAIGTFFYLGIIFIALYKLYFYDKSRKYMATFYVVNYFSIANFGESLIYSVSSYDGIVFWLFVVHALSIKKNKKIKLRGFKYA